MHVTEKNRLAAVALAAEWGIADREPVPTAGRGRRGFERIGTARRADSGGVAAYGIYGFRGVASGDPCAYAQWEGTRCPDGSASAPARPCNFGWTGLTWFTEYEPEAPAPSKVMLRMTPAEVALKAPFSVTRTMLANGYRDRAPEPEPCGIDECDCHTVTS
jgi:hypothetical protein